jgi:tetratricopeptide (TPR) repeat protein
MAFIRYLFFSSKKQEEDLKQKQIDDAVHFNTLGMKNMKLKLYHKATENFTKAINLNPKDSYFNNRACALIKNKKYDKALEDYNYILSSNKNNGSYYFGRGVVYYDLQKYDLAKTDFEKASDLDFKLAKDYLRHYFEAVPAWMNDKEPINHNIYMLETKTRYYKRQLYSQNHQSSYCQTITYSNESHFNLFLN